MATRRIAFLAGLEKSSTNLERERGFNDALQAAGVSVYRRAIGHYSFERAKEATRELFSGRGRAPDAIFVANDHMAIAAIDVLRYELGLQVPQDVSVVGFDDVPRPAGEPIGLQPWCRASRRWSRPPSSSCTSRCRRTPNPATSWSLARSSSAIRCAPLRRVEPGNRHRRLASRDPHPRPDGPLYF